MKKALIGLLTLSALSTASAANYVGGSVSIKNGIGGLNLHYQQDRNATSAMRYSLDLDALNVGSGGVSVGGSVDYLANIPNQTAMTTPITPYYGLGLGAGVALGSGSAVALYPHGVLGAKFQLSNPLSIFAEGNAGPRVVLASGASNVGFGWGARVGVNYMIGY
ncbi:hypothetical protein Dxin01_01576 [Deinococcus xinjiangensis]|uniref:Outer membrane protein beta-barrel domain-containing protein n=1 Tax=Deinococcus xinjiangensis TaxID=457454 RepID=A0ABP9V982_9DEIO